MLHIHGISHIVFLHEIVDDILLHIAQLQSCLLDGVMVERHVVCHDIACEVCIHTIFLSEISVELLDFLFVRETTGGDAMLLVHQYAVCRSVVGSQEEQIFSLADSGVEIFHEVGKTLVEVNELVLYQLAVGTILVSYLVCRREADAYHVGFALLSEFLIGDDVLCHIHRHLVSRWREVYLVFGIFAHRLVVFLYPCRKLLHIICARHELALLAVNPVGGVSGMTGGKDGGTVFYRHPDDTRLEIRCHLELVADSGAEHVARRHLSGFCLSAYASHCGIGGAIGELAVDEK